MDALETVLLRRVSRVYLPATSEPAPPDAEGWIRSLEIDLVARGWLLAAPLRRGLSQLDARDRLPRGDWLLAVADESVGADRVHTPLFRRFPNLPADLDALYVSRLLSSMFQDTDLQCVLCGRRGTVHPVEPCGHLVCHDCFDPLLFSACPICGRKTAGAGLIDLVGQGGRPASPAIRLRVISLGEDPRADAVASRDELVARASVLAERDWADLRVLIDATSEPSDLSWLPDVVPNRETSALVGAWALVRAVLPQDAESVTQQVQARWQTATDVARTLWAYSGGDPGLVLPVIPNNIVLSDELRRLWRRWLRDAPKTRVRSLPRRLRTAALTHLDALGVVNAAEDMARHRTVWLRIAERIHPFERVSTYPSAAVAFAALRGTRVTSGSDLGRAIVDACERHPRQLILRRHPDDRVSVRVVSFAAAVEKALEANDLPGALSLLSPRPGELWRRIDHLARFAGNDPDLRAAVAAAAAESTGSVAPGVLSAAAAELLGRELTVPAAQTRAQAARVVAQQPRTVVRRVWRARGRPDSATASATTTPTPEVPQRSRPEPPGPDTPRRVFFPRGDIARSWTSPETRGPLPPALVAELRASVDRELVRRAARLSRFDLAIVDRALVDVAAPTRTRASSAQLAGWTRGTRLPLPDVPVIRLFLHWVEAEGTRVDLDLSCSFFGPDWSPAWHCDYTNLRLGDAAIHSGDFTSAPAPLGATEFLDLRREALTARGIRYAIPTVYSFNDVAFELLPEAFAGFSLPTAMDAQFDPGRVMQRFDLRGSSRMFVPMVIDLHDNTLLWIDVHATSRGHGHQASMHGSQLARLGADLWEHYVGGRSPNMLDLATWHAAARADQVHVADFESGRSIELPRVDDAAAACEAVRAAARGSLTPGLPTVAGRRVVVMTTDADQASRLLGVSVDPASIIAAPVGTAVPPWQTLRPEELLAGLAPG